MFVCMERRWMPVNYENSNWTVNPWKRLTFNTGCTICDDKVYLHLGENATIHSHILNPRVIIISDGHATNPFNRQGQEQVSEDTSQQVVTLICMLNLPVINKISRSNLFLFLVHLSLSWSFLIEILFFVRCCHKIFIFSCSSYLLFKNRVFLNCKNLNPLNLYINHCKQRICTEWDYLSWL